MNRIATGIRRLFLGILLIVDGLIRIITFGVIALVGEILVEDVDNE